MSLREYIRKRNFGLTKEPKGGGKSKTSEARRFVIQKHDASRLHYDFRLELDGTLKSWAVPKGVPFKKGDRRLAVQVEDHPLDYAGFEGIIPEGQYGGGTVMVWDQGTYQALSNHPLKDLEKGKLHFALAGTKLKGEWTLVRIKDEDKQWLLLKSGEDLTPITKKRDDESVLSARTMAQIASIRDAMWESNRKPARLTAKGRNPPRPAVKFIEPMKAKLVAEPPGHGDWFYELKFDGFRALAYKDGKRTQLLSRNNKDLGARFPEIVKAIQGLSVSKAVLDGEVVALDDAGRSSFQLLQGSDIDATRPPIVYYIFDLLSEGSTDIRNKGLAARKKRLASLLAQTSEPLRLSANIEGNPHDLLKKVKSMGLEGIIGKRAESTYEAGVRSGAWIKLKCLNEQEFVIGGYTPPQGARKHFGALLVGYFDRKDFQFAGKVGTGFSAKLLGTLHRQFAKLETPACPFKNLPEKRGGRWSQNVTPAEMKRCTWIKPALVCQVKFSEWTRDGKLRHPVFLGLRDDKDARRVVREMPE